MEPEKEYKTSEAQRRAMKKYLENNKDKWAEYRKQYYEKNKFKMRQYMTDRYHKLANEEKDKKVKEDNKTFLEKVNDILPKTKKFNVTKILEKVYS